MKRVVEFQVLDDKYAFMEENDFIFMIDREDLQFDVKKFYLAFFANNQDYSDIELQKTENMDKAATHVYNTVYQLLKEICDRLKNDFAETDNSTTIPGTIGI